MATKKRKVRRYQEGGMSEEDYKQAGLAAGDKVGFFERLRMGNIDDPSSEAYRHFGAGRGRAMAVPVEDRTITEAVRGNVPMADDTYDPNVRYRDAMYEPEPGWQSGAARAAAAPAVPRATTRAAPAATPRSTSRAPAATDLSALKSSPQELISRFVALERLKEPSGLRQETMQERAQRYLDKRAAARAEEETSSPRGEDRILKNLRKPKASEFTGMGGLKFSKGGTVSKASKRADGIAQRGKTRGKMV